MKSNEPFVDYYELLQVSPNADESTIQRVFRHLAKENHPDTAGGDAERFNRLVDAYRTLTSPETRAAYDVRYQQFWNNRWQVAADATQARRLMDDEGVRERLLALFYTQRRRNMRNPGMGEMELARLVGCPHELIEFHLWYLREKSWIERLETGHFAITAAGVDQVESQRPTLDPNRLIETTGIRPEGDQAPREDAPAGTRSRKSATA
jgi:curved DNA-binding protein CbpA